jgi:Polymerase beta, Nucleotidyltransferase
VSEDEEFADRIAGRLADLPSVRAVSLGGSRARGRHRPDSDWDFAIYYRGRFEPQHLRDVGWPGDVFEPGGWGGGVFNGGAWLAVEGRRVDVHYRDLDAIDHEVAESAAGRFRIEPLMFHLAGIPSYLVVAELAEHRVLRGRLPRPGYPAALRENAPATWWGRADLTFGYAKENHAPYGRLAQCTALVVQAASQAAHAILAAGGEWVTNEKTLLSRAGLSDINRIVASARPEPDSLWATVDAARALCAASLQEASGAG